MLTSSSILGLTFFMMFKWASIVARDALFPKNISSLLYYSSLFSILLFGVTIGTIDGKGTGPLHTPCAVSFFLILLWSIIETTLFLTELHAFKTSTIDRTSLQCKQVLAGYLVGLWVYCLVMIALVSADELEAKSDRYVNIVEWNTVTVGLLWVLSFAWEWKHMNLVLISPRRQSPCEILQETEQMKESQAMRP